MRPDYGANMCATLPNSDQANEGECQAIDPTTGGGKWIFTVNGVQFPTITESKRDQDEIWRIVNASPNVTYRLALVPRAKGHDSGDWRTFQVLAIDGVSVPQSPDRDSGVYETQEILMMPGTRAEVRIPPPPGGGDFVLRTEVVSTAAHGSADVWPQVDLLAISWPKQVITMAEQLKRPGIRVLGPELPVSTATRPAAGAGLPEGCVLNARDERAIFFVHRTRPLADGSSREVFGILAGIRRSGEERVRFFDASFKEVPGLASVKDVWKLIIPDTNDPKNAAPAFDTTSFGNICAVHGGPPETWVIQNWSGEDHNFHLHQSRLTLDSAHFGDSTGHYFRFPTGNGRDQDALHTDELIQAIVAPQTSSGTPGWSNAHHDSVPVPRGEGLCADATDQPCNPTDASGNPLPTECSGDPTDGSCPKPGAVSITVEFGRDTQVGEFVYHCHILEHEDLGIMARVRVVCPDGGTSCTSDSARHGRPTGGHGTHNGG